MMALSDNIIYISVYVCVSSKLIFFDTCMPTIFCKNCHWLILALKFIKDL